MIRLKGRLSQSPNSLKRLLTGDVTQRLARFLFVRKSYSYLTNLRQRLNFSYYKDYLSTGVNCVVYNTSVDQLVKEVDKDTVCFGLHLPDAMVEEILDYAIHTACMEPGYHRTFLMSELDEYNCLPDGHHVIRALVDDLTKCQAINLIVQDSRLLQIASAYLRYYPTQITSHLTWSLVTNLTQEELKKCYPATNFHYDIAGYNFATVNFYITSVLNESSGCHIMIKGSHKKKPLWILLKSGRHSDETVYAYYGQENEIQITGKAGFGFFQDPSCFHKLKAPISQNRLLLQIRYS
ncbi:hypothetical protein JMG10_44540 [Nostoc ellipsosporum NOK]|nr:hypothetical protein [Nostoc ellipsosporum NOK]